MMWIMDNLDMIVGIIVLLIMFGISVWKFIQSGKEHQVEKIKEWLLFAVVQAEKELGGGTGQLKLRYVYDMFISKFGYVKLLVTFEEFSDMVDDSLDIMRGMLSTNAKVKEYVDKE